MLVLGTFGGIMERVGEILSFWLGDWKDESVIDASDPRAKKWFGSSEAIDREIREGFEADYIAAAAGKVFGWEADPPGAVALVLLLDQMPRNMFRGTPRAFETDPLALGVTLRAIGSMKDARLSLLERMFLYMPLMHAERRDMAEQSVERFQQLAELARERSPVNTGYFDGALGYAKQHRDIIDRFGRFPHRNAILDRTSTQDEVLFLREPGSRF